MIHICKTDDRKNLEEMCKRHNQETRDVDKVPQIWEAYDDDRCVGVAAIKVKNDKFDLAWLIVEDGYEEIHLKEELYELTLEYMKEKGAKEVYINQRDWEFYSKRGFREISDTEMPEEFRYCVFCKRRNVSCFPKSMVLVLK